MRASKDSSRRPGSPRTTTTRHRGSAGTPSPAASFVRRSASTTTSATSAAAAGSRSPGGPRAVDSGTSTAPRRQIPISVTTSSIDRPISTATRVPGPDPEIGQRRGEPGRLAPQLAVGQRAGRQVGLDHGERDVVGRVVVAQQAGARRRRPRRTSLAARRAGPSCRSSCLQIGRRGVGRGVADPFGGIPPGPRRCRRHRADHRREGWRRARSPGGDRPDLLPHREPDALPRGGRGRPPAAGRRVHRAGGDRAVVARRRAAAGSCATGRCWPGGSAAEPALRCGSSRRTRTPPR